MTRIAYVIVLIEAVICISLRFLIRRILDNKPLDWVKKLMQSSWLSLVGVMSALVGFMYLNIVVKVRLRSAGQHWAKCENAGAIEY